MIWIRKLLELLLLLMVASLWGYVGRSKLYDHQFFYNSIYGEGVSESTAWLLSYFIPIIAILAGLLLIASFVIPGVKKLAFIISTLLLGTFTIYMIYVLKIANPRPCSCIALSSEISWSKQLLISSLLLILCSCQLGILLKENRKNTQHILS